MKNVILGLSAITMMSLASCTSMKHTVDLDKGAATQTIQMKVGESYSVKLKENPSTGYGWSTQSSDNCAATVGKSEYKQDKAPDNMVGVPGTRTYEVKGDKAGKCTITFQQSPPGSKEVVNTKVLHVVVK